MTITYYANSMQVFVRDGDAGFTVKLPNSNLAAMAGYLRELREFYGE